jgi:hypothetical protein
MPHPSQVSCSQCHPRCQSHAVDAIIRVKLALMKVCRVAWLVFRLVIYTVKEQQEVREDVKEPNYLVV